VWLGGAARPISEVGADLRISAHSIYTRHREDRIEIPDMSSIKGRVGGRLGTVHACGHP
jgi:hypothetical protein